MKTKCISVRLKSLVSISDKAYKTVAFDGSEAIIPKSQVFSKDYSVIKSEAYWISQWILDKKNIQYSAKKQAWFNQQGVMLPSYKVKLHKPIKVEPLKSNEIDDLAK